MRRMTKTHRTHPKVQDGGWASTAAPVGPSGPLDLPFKHVIYLQLKGLIWSGRKGVSKTMLCSTEITDLDLIRHFFQSILLETFLLLALRYEHVPWALTFLWVSRIISGCYITGIVRLRRILKIIPRSKSLIYEWGWERLNNLCFVYTYIYSSKVIITIAHLFLLFLLFNTYAH